MSQEPISGNTSDPTRGFWTPTAWAIPILLVALLAVLAAKFNSQFPQGYLKALEFDKNFAKWQSFQISHYRIEVYLREDNNAHPEPWIIEVRDGKAVSVKDNNGAIIAASEDAYSTYDIDHYFTIPGWFRYVNETYETRPPEVSVEFDPTYGYPAKVYVLPYREPCCEQDFIIGIWAFMALP